MKNLTKLASCIAIALLFLFNSCSQDWRDTQLAEHDSEFAFPLFSTDLFFKDLIVNVLNDQSFRDTLIFNSDKTMTLIYSGDVAEKKAVDLYKFSLLGPVPVSDSFYVLPIPAGDVDSLSIRKVILKQGKITNFFAWNNGQTQPVVCTFKIPQMTKNGVPFTKVMTIPPNPSGTINPGFIEFSSYDLNGYQLLNTSKENELFFTYDARLPNGDRIKLEGANPAAPQIVFTFDTLKFSYLEGYWGNQTYSLGLDTIDIDINSSNLKGNIVIKDPKITVTVANSFGFPTQGKIKYLRFVGKDGNQYELTSPVIASGIDFAYPSLLAGEIGKTKHSSFTFDSQNSNIADIFNSQPVQMIYAIDGVANAQKDTSLIGFITDSSVVKFGVTVELLLEGSAENFGADQKLNLDFGDYSTDNTDGIEEIEFKLVTENKMPVSTSMQLYFQDAAGTTLDSLFLSGVTQISTAAEVDANGFPTGVERSETFIPMSKARFDVVRTAKMAFLKASFSTTLDANGNPKMVKLLSDNSTKVKMGIRVKTKL